MRRSDESEERGSDDETDAGSRRKTFERGRLVCEALKFPVGFLDQLTQRFNLCSSDRKNRAKCVRNSRVGVFNEQSHFGHHVFDSLGHEEPDFAQQSADRGDLRGSFADQTES